VHWVLSPEDHREADLATAPAPLTILAEVLGRYIPIHPVDRRRTLKQMPQPLHHAQKDVLVLGRVVRQISLSRSVWLKRP
jgi:hypothetical protein